jgi:putative nucleotidyltransferase with HDIG domain
VSDETLDLGNDEPTTEESSSLVGMVIGGYRLIAPMRSGGMGTVYYGEHTLIGRRAAIKILHPEVSRNPSILTRFLTEARAANDIRHPNVVEITDIGSVGDIHYIVMSYLEGETLGERLERNRILDEETTVRIVRQVASALTAAHDHGIVHRDLKPDNIFLLNHPDYPDYVKLLDFGIAKLLAPQDPSQLRTTQVGTVVGTPDYMSPEQCREGAKLDHRSDIYSLGVVLYEMVTGVVPFNRESPPDVMLAHRYEAPVPPIEHNPKLSQHLNLAILQALEKDPAKRFSDMREFRAAIENGARAPEVISKAPAQHAGTRKRESHEATQLIDRLTDIIFERLEHDSLLLPAMPAVAARCMQVIDDPKQDFKSVANLVSKDPILAVHVLRLANSAAFPSRSPATTLELAISRLGIEGLRLAICQFSMYRAFSSKDERIQAAFLGIWEHSLAVALIAREIAGQFEGPGGPDPGNLYLVGLLHDIGKPVVASLLLETEKLMAVQKSKIPWIGHAVWRQVVDRSHRNVGVALARCWKLPECVGDAIEKCMGYDHTVPLAPSNVVCLANAFAKVHGLYAGDFDVDQVTALLVEGKDLLDLPDEALALLCAGIYRRVGSLFETKTPSR